MSHRRQPAAGRAALLVFRTARMGLLLGSIPALPALAVYLCFAGTPAP
ncbi:hypothetical protein [Streptomyces violaceusniger]|uniref:Uncharacterized protein n=1 Tax=Streptomyces violaceusniger (strain Tu 4113) TaxID=653045 RepID=G2P143_STRV4|nr:hypothetical protein [Streptomyces violaceusniger]AEM87882.1 hypothetical protein Strvi_8574 [Streptomyces violaceusniger Tu 4113]